MKNFLILTNPNKKIEKVTNRVRSSLKELRLPFAVCNNLENQSLETFTGLIIIGGDGTLNYVINHLSNFDLPIGIIPAGSGNDYVKSLSIGRTLEEQIETAINGQIKEVDIGQCNDHLFLNGFGLGFDGQIAKEFEENRTILRGHAAYYYHVIRILANYQPRPLKFSIDGQSFQEKILLLTIAKGTTFGGGFKLTPHANLDDGQFGIGIIRDLKPLKRFLNVHRLKDGSHDQFDEVDFVKGKQIKIEAQPDMTAHIDGELIGNPPFEIRVLPKKLKIRST